MENALTTNRLALNRLSHDDAAFVFELVNSPGWIKFIGDRNVKTLEDARAMITRIINNPNISYWVVRMKDGFDAIGIVSFIKRDYLEHHDLGFAFLPIHSGKGYAYEAATAFLQRLATEGPYQQILATTVKENLSSIALLKKIGFSFDREIQVDSETLHVYSIDMDRFQIDQLTRSFFSLFNNKDNRAVNLSAVYDLCLREAIIIKKSKGKNEVYTLPKFIEPRQRILTNGTLLSFEEKETSSETKIAGGIAQRFSHYEKSGVQNGSHFKQSGNKIFQFIKTGNDWKINAVAWEDDE